MTCPHKSCSHEENIWLPIENRLESEAALHPWCVHCGLIKNISDDRPKKIGHWMNILSRLSYYSSITQCQKRLVSRELESYKEFYDTYGVTGSAQKEMFVKIVKKYCSIGENNIDSFLC